MIKLLTKIVAAMTYGGLFWIPRDAGNVKVKLTLGVIN